MSSFNKELIESISNQIIKDDYSETEQKKAKNMPPFLEYTLEFIRRNLKYPNILEIGAGSGQSLEFFPISRILEPCSNRAQSLREKHPDTDRIIHTGFAENIPLANKSFSSVLLLDTFDQVRSTMEALAEINRVLEPGGVLIFDCGVDDAVDIVYGVVYGFKNLGRYVEDFGFKTIEMRTIKGRGLYAMEKLYEWSPKMLSKLQIINKNEVWVAKNFHPEEEFHKKYL